MVWAALSLGSNVQPEANLSSCLDELLLQFRDLALSSVFRSSAENTEAPDYLNMAVGIETSLPLQELNNLLKKIEDKHKRTRNTSSPALVTLDIDLLLYAEKVGCFNGINLPRPGIADTAYVLWPLSQIAAKKQHPVLKQSYVHLWKALEKTAQSITPVEFIWHERVVSRAL